MDLTHFKWWQSGVVYQIYPRSFKDSNGDGIGDLAGIVENLDYLSWLGVGAIWLSPFYPSPQADFGYDVSDYTAVDRLYGTLADFDQLVEEAHRRGLKIIVDLVLNHSSDEHPWFVEACSSRVNPKRDWYIWRDPQVEGGPPNNWLSHFGGSAWQFDRASGQYYLHLFHTKQPDFNWRNPRLRAAIYEVMRFWLEHGVDGFRLDALPFLIKDSQWRDNPLNPEWQEGDHFWGQYLTPHIQDQPEIHQIMQEMRQLVDQYPDRVLIGEMYLPYTSLMDYYGQTLDELHLPFNFGLLGVGEWSAERISELVAKYETALPAGAWPNWVLGNHDVGRIASRIGANKARLAQMLLLTLRGTPTCYYGDELGMSNGVIPPSLTYDPAALASPGNGRDPARTPLQWDNRPNAGFCPPGVSPWLPVSADFKRINIQTERSEPASLLNLVQQLIALRNASPALSLGTYKALPVVAADCLVYRRQLGRQSFVVVLNFADRPRKLNLGLDGPARLVISTGLDRQGKINLNTLAVAAHEGLVIELEVDQI